MGLFSNNKKLCPLCGAPMPHLRQSYSPLSGNEI